MKNRPSHLTDGEGGFGFALRRIMPANGGLHRHTANCHTLYSLFEAGLFLGFRAVGWLTQLFQRFDLAMRRLLRVLALVPCVFAAVFGCCHSCLPLPSFNRVAYWRFYHSSGNVLTAV